MRAQRQYRCTALSATLTSAHVVLLSAAPLRPLRCLCQCSHYEPCHEYVESLGNAGKMAFMWHNGSSIFAAFLWFGFRSKSLALSRALRLFSVFFSYYGSPFEALLSPTQPCSLALHLLGVGLTIQREGIAGQRSPQSSQTPLNWETVGVGIKTIFSLLSPFESFESLIPRLLKHLKYIEFGHHCFQPFPNLILVLIQRENSFGIFFHRLNKWLTFPTDDNFERKHCENCERSQRLSNCQRFRRISGLVSVEKRCILLLTLRTICNWSRV